MIIKVTRYCPVCKRTTKHNLVGETGLATCLSGSHQVPGTAYNHRQLLGQAYRAGVSLFGPDTTKDDPTYPYNRGLEFNFQVPPPVHAKMSEVPPPDPDTEGECYDENPAATPYVDDYEFQFFPSTGAGADVSGDHLSTLVPDTDGNIYLYWPETGIRIIHTKEE